MPRTMLKNSIGKQTTRYFASAALLSALIIAASTLYLGIPATTLLTSGSTGSTSLGGPQSLLIVQLTDPPQVPTGTRSLNLTYSSLDLVVGEPSGNGQVNPTSVGVTPTGGLATLSLLTLQNVSQTVASASLPNGSFVYSVAFMVSSIAINVNGTVSAVMLATGSNTFSVTISQPPSLQGVNVALLQLNPIVVGTPSGYQLIPSSVGVIKHTQGSGQEEVGSQHKLTPQDKSYLQDAHGNLTASLTALSVSGDATSLTVQVENTGGAAVTLYAIGLHGNFTTTSSDCSTTTTTSTTSASSTTTTHGSSSHTDTETETQSQTHTGSENSHRACQLPEHMNEVVFVPAAPSAPSSSSSTSTTTSGVCGSEQVKLVNGGADQGDGRGFVLQAGQCVNFVFNGTITFGESANVVLPSTAAGQTYDIHVIADAGANVQLACVLPLGATSCKTDTEQGSGNGD